MSTDTTRAREIAATLLAEIAKLRAVAPDDVPLLAAERAARLCADALEGIIDPPVPDAGAKGIIEPPYPGAIADGSVEPPRPDAHGYIDPPYPGRTRDAK